MLEATEVQSNANLDTVSWVEPDTFNTATAFKHAWVKMRQRFSVWSKQRVIGWTQLFHCLSRHEARVVVIVQLKGGANRGRVRGKDAEGIFRLRMVARWEDSDLV